MADRRDVFLSLSISVWCERWVPSVDSSIKPHYHSLLVSRVRQEVRRWQNVIIMDVDDETIALEGFSRAIAD